MPLFSPDFPAMAVVGDVDFTAAKLHLEPNLQQKIDNVERHKIIILGVIQEVARECGKDVDVYKIYEDIENRLAVAAQLIGKQSDE